MKYRESLKVGFKKRELSLFLIGRDVELMEHDGYEVDIYKHKGFHWCDVYHSDRLVMSQACESNAQAKRVAESWIDNQSSHAPLR